MAVAQHTVHADEAILVPTIPLQTWNSPQGGQVHYTDTAAGASYDCGWSLAV